MSKKVYYVIQNRDGKFFKFDESSGGYPVFTDSPESCEWFRSAADAESFLKDSYVGMFKEDFSGAVVSKVTIRKTKDFREIFEVFRQRIEISYFILYNSR